MSFRAAQIFACASSDRALPDAKQIRTRGAALKPKGRLSFFLGRRCVILLPDNFQKLEDASMTTSWRARLWRPRAPLPAISSGLKTQRRVARERDGPQWASGACDEGRYFSQ